MTEDTEALIQRWILAFCEMPIIVDPALMRLVLDGHDSMIKETGHVRNDV